MYYNYSRFHQLKLQGAIICSKKVNWKIHRNNSLKIFKHKNSFMHLPIEVCFWTLNSFIIIENFWKHLTLIISRLPLFFVLYTVTPGYFNEPIYEIMKWNISKIKHHSYEILNMQVYLIVLVLTHGNLQFWGISCKEKVIFITGMPFFLLLPLESKFLQVLNHKCS